MNILDLISADGVKLKKYWRDIPGPVPFHDGKTETSLLVDADAGKYHCFGCDMHGDAIQWLRERRGLSFLEACEYLGHDPGPRKEQPRTAPAAWEPREGTTPAAIWQERARAFLDEAIDTLWSGRGAKLRAWLRLEKGLHDATIKEACLGLALPTNTNHGQRGALILSLKRTERKKAMDTGGPYHSLGCQWRRSPLADQAQRSGRRAALCYRKRIRNGTGDMES